MGFLSWIIEVVHPIDVLTIPQAQVSCLPRKRGEGRFLASADASSRQRLAYSSLTNFAQKPSVNSVISAATDLASLAGEAVAADVFFPVR